MALNIGLLMIIRRHVICKLFSRFLLHIFIMKKSFGILIWSFWCFGSKPVNENPRYGGHIPKLLPCQMTKMIELIKIRPEMQIRL